MIFSIKVVTRMMLLHTSAIIQTMSTEALATSSIKDRMHQPVPLIKIPGLLEAVKILFIAYLGVMGKMMHIVHQLSF